MLLNPDSIKEFLNVKESDMVYEPGGEEYVMIRGECFPVVRLSRKYHLEHAKEDVSDGIMILVEHEDKKMCVFVDHLIGGPGNCSKTNPIVYQKSTGVSRLYTAW